MMKELIFKNDPYEMNWVRPDFPYGEVGVPEELSATSASVREGDVVRTEIRIKNEGKKPYFTNIEDIQISFPVPDQYEDSKTSLIRRCHTHLFCGKDVSWICALRMGGEAPHLGMVVTEGSLAAYSVRRNLLRQSNDRGCFYLHPEGMELEAGEEKVIRWVIFPHEGKEDFLKKAGEYNPHFVDVRADRYVLFPGEKSVLTIRPAFQAEQVSVNGEALTEEDGIYTYTFTAAEPGEKVFEIAADQVHTRCRLFVQEEIHSLTEKRCHFIAEHQQYEKEGMLKGAYLIYDNEEERQIYRPENDFNGGRERIGMGVLMARFLQGEKTGSQPELEESLKKYLTYVKRELVDVETGKTCNDAGMDDSFKRLYNAPWAATFFAEIYRLWKQDEDLRYSCQVIRHYYEEGGRKFYPIELPVTLVMGELKKAGWQKEYDELLELFVDHADHLCEVGKNYPASEVNYEQSIVAPAADVILSVYLLTGDKKYLDEGARQVEILELFNGMQPDYHLNEVAIRHWDGYWFGKRRYYGDTFPHYWSALTGKVFKMYGEILKDENWIRRGEASIRGVLPLFFTDGRAACAYVYPLEVNDRRADFFDPYANDQDWGLYANIR